METQQVATTKGTITQNQSVKYLLKAYTYQRRVEEGKACMEIEKDQQSSKCNNASYDEPRQRALKATHELQERLTTDLPCLNYI